LRNSYRRPGQSESKETVGCILGVLSRLPRCVSLAAAQLQHCALIKLFSCATSASSQTALAGCASPTMHCCRSRIFQSGVPFSARRACLGACWWWWASARRESAEQGLKRSDADDHCFSALLDHLLRWCDGGGSSQLQKDQLPAVAMRTRRAACPADRDASTSPV
jgi:hypothetical protein